MDETAGHLPSWNEMPTRQAIVEFVERVGEEAAPTTGARQEPGAITVTP